MVSLQRTCKWGTYVFGTTVSGVLWRKYIWQLTLSGWWKYKQTNGNGDLSWVLLKRAENVLN